MTVTVTINGQRVAIQPKWTRDKPLCEKISRALTMNDVKEVISKIYQFSETGWCYASGTLERLSKNGGISHLIGKKILVLASGAAYGEGERNRTYEPWLCRALREAGAEVTAIDLHEQPEEAFASHAVDLSKKGALNFLPETLFEYIICERFVSFAEYERLCLVSPDLKKNTNEGDRKAIREELLLQAKRLLVDRGSFVTFHDDWMIFQKQNGELCNIGRYVI